MELYQEQTVARRPSGRDKLLYILTWLLVCFAALLMVVFAAGSVNFSPEGGISVNWFSAFGFLVSGAAAVLLWNSKDKLRMEYDYSLRGGVLEVCAVYNGRRRQQRIGLEIGEITACVVGGNFAAAGMQVHKWFLNPEAMLYCLTYSKNGQQHAMLLELNPEMAAQLRKELRPGVWHDEEGKSF